MQRGIKSDNSKSQMLCGPSFDLTQHKIDKLDLSQRK